VISPSWSAGGRVIALRWCCIGRRGGRVGYRWWKGRAASECETKNSRKVALIFHIVKIRWSVVTARLDKMNPETRSHFSCAFNTVIASAGERFVRELNGHLIRPNALTPHAYLGIFSLERGQAFLVLV